MREFGSIEDVLAYAIEREGEAHEFYMKLAGWVEKPELCEVLERFAGEELDHRRKLELFRAGDEAIGDDEVGSLGIADGVEDGRAKANMEYADALLFAMRKEKLAFRLYTALSEASKDAAVKDLFRRLAQEEAGHKLRVEIEYDLATF